MMLVEHDVGVQVVPVVDITASGQGRSNPEWLELIDGFQIARLYGGHKVGNQMVGGGCPGSMNQSHAVSHECPELIPIFRHLNHSIDDTCGSDAARRQTLDDYR